MRPASPRLLSWIAAASLPLAGCATAAPHKAPAPAAAPLPPVPVTIPPGPGGSVEVMALQAEARGKPVQLALGTSPTPRVVVVFDSLAVEVLRLPPAAGPGEPLSVPVEARQLVAERLLSATSASRLTVALGLADENHETRILGSAPPRRLADLRPCAAAAGEASSIVVAEKPPRPGSSSADLVLIPDSGAPVPLGAHATGDLCGAAQRGDGFFVAWNDARGRLLVRPVDARGRSAGATVALPLPQGERLVSPALAPVAGSALLVATSRRDGAVRGFALDGQGRAHGPMLTVAPSDGESETGGASVMPIPGGGFAVAWYAARPGGDASPTTLRLAWLSPAEEPVGGPLDLLAPLALATGPAPLAGVEGGVLAGGVILQDGTTLARVVRVPAPTYSR